ncbi:MAG: hypothetical protein J7K82_00440 [Thermoproteales archaeon]|nr:hypothetical protein [Thermoproteales archaeon]
MLLPEDIERLSRVTGLNPEKFAVPVQGLEPYTHKLKRSGRADLDSIAPYWRILKSDGSLNEKFPGGVKLQVERLKMRDLK